MTITLVEAYFITKNRNYYCPNIKYKSYQFISDGTFCKLFHDLWIGIQRSVMITLLHILLLLPSNFFSSNQWSEFLKLDYFIGKSTQWAQIWSESKLRSLDTIWTHFVSKLFANTCIFSKLKSYLVLTGAQCNYRQACADLPNHIPK